MQKILVTGGVGFIGSHTVVELFNHGYHPVIIDNFSNSVPSALEGIRTICSEQIEFHEGDCTDVDFLDKVFRENGPISGVIHFAAHKAVGESVKEPLKYYQNNVGSLLVLIGVMEKHRCKNLVFSSSCTVYGQPDSLPVTEEFNLGPASSPYGYTKQVCEQILKDLHAVPHTPLSSVLLRYFNPIGAHPSGLIGELPLGTPENLIPYITQTAAQLRDKLTVFGTDYDTVDGTCVRDYIHVVDLAKAHVQALKWLDKNEQACGIFNLGTGNGSSVKEVIDAFEEVSGVKLNYQMGERRAGDIEKIYASSDYAQKELDWKCDYSLKDSLRDAWNWQLKLQNKKDLE